MLGRFARFGGGYERPLPLRTHFCLDRRIRLGARVLSKGKCGRDCHRSYNATNLQDFHLFPTVSRRWTSRTFARGDIRAVSFSLRSYASLSDFGRLARRKKGHASASFARVRSLVVGISNTDEQQCADDARRALYEDRVCWAISITFRACCHFWAPPVRNTCSQAIRLAGTQAAFSRSLQNGQCL